jgi:hypothetical protein
MSVGKQIGQSMKMKVGMWAAVNKEKFKGKNLKEAAKLVKDGMGATITASTAKDLFRALELEPRVGKRGGSTITSIHSHHRLRMLARVVAEGFAELGLDPDPRLAALCSGDALPGEEEATPANGKAKD